MSDALIALLLSFGISTALAFPIIAMMKKLKAKQVILSYVDNHTAKSGTPTMGGLIFLAGAILSAAFLFKGDKLTGFMTLAITAAYAVNGFLDDFIKVRFKRNGGLSAIQKIIFQLTIAVIVGLFVYYNSALGGEIYLPFSSRTIDLKWGIIPFVALFFIAVTNSVNLTDGLDGLAGGVSLVFFVVFGIILYVVADRLNMAGESQDILSGINNIFIFCFALAGGLLGFLLFNSHPAKIFMGDTGSLALGGAVGAVTVFSKQALIVPIIGIMFVASSISVILQVLHYKRTKRRIFLMAPLHHHFERKGFHEVKITAMYMIITAVAGAGALLATILIF